MKRYIAILCIMLMLLSGCARSSQDPEIGVDVPEDTSDMFTDRDMDTSSQGATDILLTDRDVMISEEGVYRLSGTLSDGQICVNAPKEAKLHLILDGVSVTSTDRAPLYIKQADKVVITLVGENTLTGGESFRAQDDNSIDAPLFSKEDLTINGEGKLTVKAPVGHGIVSKDDLVIAGGTLEISAAAHGVSGKDSVRLRQTELVMEVGKDGVHAENGEDSTLGFVYIESGTLDIVCGGDGISAGSYMNIGDGTFRVESGGGSENATQSGADSFFSPFGGGYYAEEDETDTVSSKGIKADGSMRIAGGSYTLNCADDALHSGTDLTVEEGNFEIRSGDDGLHADGTLDVVGGSINILESYEGLEGLRIQMRGGIVSLVASDDGLNAAGGNDGSGMGGPGGRGDMFSASSDSDITISGGELWVYADGDGIDSNGSFHVTGGQTIVAGPTSGGNGILDYSSGAEITGGTFLAYGSSDMAQNFTQATQGAMMVSTRGSEGSVIRVEKDGKALIELTAEQSFACIIFSSPEVVKGNTYTLSVDGESAQITMQDYIYGATSGMGGPGGRGDLGRPQGGGMFAGELL